MNNLINLTKTILSLNYSPKHSELRVYSQPDSKRFWGNALALMVGSLIFLPTIMSPFVFKDGIFNLEFILFLSGQIFGYRNLYYLYKSINSYKSIPEVNTKSKENLDFMFMSGSFKD